MVTGGVRGRDRAALRRTHCFADRRVVNVFRVLLLVLVARRGAVALYGLLVANVSAAGGERAWPWAASRPGILGFLTGGFGGPAGRARLRWRALGAAFLGGLFVMGACGALAGAIVLGILTGGLRRVPRRRLSAPPPSSRGLGRHPFKVEIRGSNPLGGTRVAVSSFLLPYTQAGRVSPEPLIGPFKAGVSCVQKFRPFRARIGRFWPVRRVHQCWRSHSDPVVDTRTNERAGG